MTRSADCPRRRSTRVCCAAMACGRCLKRFRFVPELAHSAVYTRNWKLSHRFSSAAKSHLADPDAAELESALAQAVARTDYGGDHESGLDRRAKAHIEALAQPGVFARGVGGHPPQRPLGKLEELPERVAASGGVDGGLG